ncbi:MAG: T9SS type A sorting domain-containing protein [Flavobacteriales bacterium]|nr:T9SS type A sorting domain-containing protein [Flavobacteriales bacterium]
MTTFSRLLVLIAITLVQFNYAQTLTPAQGVKLGMIDPTVHQEKWNLNIQHMDMPDVNGTSEKAMLLRIKSAQQEKYPRKVIVSQEKSFDNSLGSNVFTSINGFEGNPYNSRVPDDNTLAISNDGILISCINSKYLFYDTQADTLMDEGFLNDFIASYNLTVSKYDPKVAYDPNEDKFILTFLVGNLYQNSKVVMCFSTTNNPMDPWNVYLLDGNALGSNHWTDYPALAITEDEIFLTGNLVENSTAWQTGFYQSIIWQIDKWSGYDGATQLDMQIWSDIKDDTIKIRNIHPVTGARNLQGPKQYFLSNKNFSAESDTVYLISIDNTLASGVANIEIKQLSTPDHYFMAPNAKQSISKELATNDSRVLGAITDGDWIQYVHNTMDTANGTCAVYHGFIQNISSTTPTVSGVIISDTVMDLGYPNIASASNSDGDLECVIGFDFTSPVDTNGVACVYRDNNSAYSEVIKLHTGLAPINILSGSVDRWGDYFGIQRKYNEPCNVWLAGMYGKQGANGCWISSVKTQSSCEENFAHVLENATQPNANIYPNPVHNVAKLELFWKQSEMVTIKVVDIQGKTIELLYEDLLKKGNNQISFFTDHLTNGVYFLQIQSATDMLTKKFVVE